MGVRLVTDIQKELRSVDIATEQATEKLISTFAYVGEACVREARIKANFIDRTGNLRSSIGYVLKYNGEIVQLSGFTPLHGGADGSQQGKAFALQVAERAKGKGITLIVVAGMEYASYVANRGYDVIDSAELMARRLVPSLLNKLKL